MYMCHWEYGEQRRKLDALDKPLLINYTTHLILKLYYLLEGGGADLLTWGGRVERAIHLGERVGRGGY